MKAFTMILLTLLICTLAADTGEWIGDWIDSDTRTVFTIQLDPEPTVVKAVDLDDDSSYDILRSQWSDDGLSWTIFVPSSEVTLTYTATKIDDAGMQTSWENNYDSGVEALTRYDIVGEWHVSDVHIVIDRVGDGYSVSRMFLSSTGEDIEIVNNVWSNDALSWSFKIPDSDIVSTITTQELRQYDALYCMIEDAETEPAPIVLRRIETNPAAAIDPAEIVSVWLDQGIQVYYSIHLLNDAPTVMYVYDLDVNKEHPVSHQNWEDGALEWSIYIEESQTTLTYRTTKLANDVLRVEWWNDGGNSGVDNLTRMPVSMIDTAALVGQWMDTELNARFTFREVDGETVVTRAWDMANDREIVLLESAWDGQSPRWTIHLPGTDTDITYWGEAIHNGVLAASWHNGYSSGIEDLEPLVEQSLFSDPLAGLWYYEDIEFIISKIDGAYYIMQINDIGAEQSFPVLQQSFQDDKLAFSYLRATSGHVIHISLEEPQGETLPFQWEESDQRGEDVMLR